MKITVVQLRKILLMAALGLTMSTIPAQAQTPVNLSQAAQIKTYKHK
jgi:hypothetical protein